MMNTRMKYFVKNAGKGGSHKMHIRKTLQKRIRKPMYPIDRMTLRKCFFCNWDTTDHIRWINHMREHTPEEKALLTNGDIGMIMNILEAKLENEMRQDLSRKCCDGDDCLHNYENTHQEKLRVLINKLRNYDFKGKNGVYSIAAIPDHDFMTTLSEEMDYYRKQKQQIQPYQYRAFFYRVEELLFMIPRRLFK